MFFAFIHNNIARPHSLTINLSHVTCRYFVSRPLAVIGTVLRPSTLSSVVSDVMYCG